MSKTLFLCLSGLIFFAPEQVDAKAWRGIIPLHSTRGDVERLLGIPTDPNKQHSSVYQLENETVSIFYASGPPCGDDTLSGWQVPRGTVVSITVSPKTKVRVSDLEIDLTRYKKRTDPHSPDKIVYLNVEEGESINVFLDEVMYFTFFPASKDKHLECPPSPATINDLSRQYPRLDRYSDISFEDEKIRLDNFAGHLQQQSKSKGYIVVYAGPRSSVDEVRARAERAKNYLVTRDIKANRLLTIYGGYREEFTVELYVVDRSAKSNPTIRQLK